MEKTKKLIALLFCFAIVLTSAACGGQPAAEDEDDDVGGGSSSVSVSVGANIVDMDFSNMNESAPLGETVGELSSLQLQAAYSNTDNQILSGPGASIKYGWQEGSFRHHIVYTVGKQGSTGVRIESSSAAKAPTSWYILQPDGSVYSVDSTSQTYQKTTLTQAEFSNQNATNMRVCSGLADIANNLYVNGNTVEIGGATYTRFVQNNSDSSVCYIYVDSTNIIRYIIVKNGFGEVGAHQIDISAAADANVVSVPSTYRELEAQVATTTTLETIPLTLASEDTNYIAAPTTTSGIFTLSPSGGSGGSVLTKAIDVINYTTPEPLPDISTFTPDAPFGEELTDLSNITPNLLVTILMGTQKDLLDNPSLMTSGMQRFISETTPLQCNFKAHDIANGKMMEDDMEFVLNSSGGRAYKYWDPDSDLGFSSWAIETNAGVRTTINRLGEKEEKQVGTKSLVVDYFDMFAHYADVQTALNNLNNQNDKYIIVYNAAVINGSTFLRATITHEQKEIKPDQEDTNNDTIEHLYYNGSGILTYIVRYSQKNGELLIASCEFTNAVNAKLFDLSTFGGPKVEVEEAVDTDALDTTQPASETTAPADTQEPVVTTTVAGGSDDTTRLVDAGGFAVTESTTQATDAGGFAVPSFTSATTTTEATTTTTTAPPAPVATISFTPEKIENLHVDTSSKTPLGESLGDTAVDKYRDCFMFTNNFTTVRLNSMVTLTSKVISGTGADYTTIIARQNGSDTFYFTAGKGGNAWYIDLAGTSYQLDAASKTYKTTATSASSVASKALSFLSPDILRVAVQQSCVHNDKVFTRYGLVNDVTGTKYFVYVTPDNLIAYVYSMTTEGVVELMTIASSDAPDAGYFAIPSGYTMG